MSLIAKLYNWLEQGPAPDCDRLIEAALEKAEPDWAARLHDVLIKRECESSWAVLLGQFESLSEQVRQQVLGDEERFDTALPRALRSPSTSARAGALRALHAAPSVRTIYLASDALRDPDVEVRSLAGKLLHRVADEFLERKIPADDAEALAKFREDRGQIAQALAEALRTFDLHERGDVLEASLWFARDVGADLWKCLTSPRSRAGMIVDDRIRTWNDPRLAGFLLSALCQPAWAELAAKLLENWSSPTEVSAILRASRALENPDFRQRLHSIRSPKWFNGLSPTLEEIPASLRGLAPRWVVELGYTDLQKVAILSRWLWAPDQNVHRNTVYALAKINTADAIALLREVANSDSPLSEYTRWCIQSYSDSTGSPAAAASNPGKRGNATAGDDLAKEDCELLWQACRRTTPDARSTLIELFRSLGRVWRTELRRYLKSSDPRDRVLALQIVSTRELAPLFRPDLEPLSNDPVEGIRGLARTLLGAVPETEAEPPASSAIDNSRLTQDPERMELHGQMRVVLEALANGEPDADARARIDELTTLLKRVYLSLEEDPAEATVAEETPE